MLYTIGSKHSAANITSVSDVELNPSGRLLEDQDGDSMANFGRVITVVLDDSFPRPNLFKFSLSLFATADLAAIIKGVCCSDIEVIPVLCRPSGNSHALINILRHEDPAESHRFHLFRITDTSYHVGAS